MKAGVGGAVALALSLGVMTPAYADLQPNANDAVGVGSDTVQYVGNFLADGDVSGDSGYNANNTSRRLVSFDATADANGRSSYLNGSSTLLAPTIVLRQGTKPVVRPNGSGAGIAALLADSAHQIDYVRSSRLPSTAEKTDPRATAFGGIHTYKIATDSLQIAVASTTNAPAALSATDLANIYNGTYVTWNQIPGNSAGSSAAILPLLPQPGSGTRKDFTADIKTLTGVDLEAPGVLASTVKLVEENDAGAITGSSSPANALAPFSAGRNNLINTGYFGSNPAPNTIKLLTGTGAYVLSRTLYILVRGSDVTSTTPFQLGSTLNLVNTFFGKSTSWYAKPANSALFTAAGVTQSWQDLG